MLFVSGRGGYDHSKDVFLYKNVVIREKFLCKNVVIGYIILYKNVVKHKEHLVKRQVIKELQRWKEAPRRKPLIVSGARQVGKTWLMKEFGRTCFERTAYITFDDNPQLAAAFEGALSPQRLLPILQAEAGVRIDEGTLLVLDEVQESPRAIQSLKYFNEQAPQLPVIAGGSALGLALRKGKRAWEEGQPRASFPVGKVSFLDLYPLNFSEFLGGIGEELLAELLETLDWEAITPFHDRLTELLKQYLFVGGMPEAVLAFAQTADPAAARRVHGELLRSYNADFSKYADDALAERIRRVWRAVPANLAKENRKFMFSKIRESARAREYEDALQWLTDTSLVCPSNCVSLPESPLVSHEDEGAFKVYLLDVGLLGAMNSLNARAILDNDALFSSFKGSLAEQFVAQEMLACGQAGNNLDPGNKLHYFMNPSTRTEIDFIVDGNTLASQPIPIEVKSGLNLKAKSLAAFVKKYQPLLAVRTSLAHPAQDGVIEDVPLYAFGAYFRKNIAGE